VPQRDIGVAIGLPEPYTSELQTWRERLGDPNAASIPPHVTLLPPTVLTDAALDGVERHLRQVAEAGRSFAMQLRGSGTFRPVSPVVFVPLVQGISECEQLETSVRAGPLARPVRFPYHPHVTVAHEVPEPLLDTAFDELATYDATFSVWGFSLFEKAGDGVWRPQRDFPFGGAALGPVQDRGRTGRAGP
jgi:2'-5' RNA ligase